jgi:hypothetical protein
MNRGAEATAVSQPEEPAVEPVITETFDQFRYCVFSDGPFQIKDREEKTRTYKAGGEWHLV